MTRDAAGSSGICLDVCEANRDAITVTLTLFNLSSGGYPLSGSERLRETVLKRASTGEAETPFPTSLPVLEESELAR